MRKRDLAILLLSAFAIFFSLQHEGDFSFKEASVHLSEEYPIKYVAERLPPPVVADLNGDGKKEVLVATHDAKIQVLEPHARRVDEGYSEARVLAEVSLLPDKISISSGRCAVAMATGFVDRNYDKREPRKQVLVVVTSAWFVMCFDHNLKKLWEEDFPHNAHHREVAISISNYTLKHGDADLVIIGGRMEVQPHDRAVPGDMSLVHEEATWSTQLCSVIVWSCHCHLYELRGIKHSDLDRMSAVHNLYIMVVKFSLRFTLKVQR